jgi:hypothetical protein
MLDQFPNSGHVSNGLVFPFCAIAHGIVFTVGLGRDRQGNSGISMGFPQEISV